MVAAIPVKARKTTRTPIARRVRIPAAIGKKSAPDYGSVFASCVESNILVEQGTDTSRLLIAFTGFQGALTMPPYDFFAASGHLGASRILLRDSTHLLYFRGCPPDAPGFHVLLERLKSEIARLSPERITCAGTSSGGFAALLFGYLLGADRVHAFAPTIYGSVWLTLLHRDWHQLRNSVSPNHLMRELLIPPSLWKYRDLPRLLRTWNGKTDFTIHLCAHHKHDMKRTKAFEGLPHVEIVTHECSTHQVARHLVRAGKLLDVFRD